MKPHVLVLSASVGAGHMRAADAVTAALREMVPSATVENRDVLEFTNPLFRRVYGKAYLDLVNRAPHLVGFIYDHMDRPSRSSNRLSERLLRAVDKLNLKPFEDWLLAARPDLVINTHFLPAERIARLRVRGKIAVPQVTVCTDFDTHRLWVNQPCDRYFVATEEGADHLVHWGVERTAIELIGIPVDLGFSRPVDRQACLARFNLVGDRPIVLQMCGGFGVGPVEGVFESLLEAKTPMDLVVVCGRNAKLKTALSELTAPERHRVHILGFTAEMDQLMGCADIVVSKPGGLTTSEILARGLAMVIVNPIPGQEDCNSDYLLENGAAVKANHPSSLSRKLNLLLESPDRLSAMQAAARRIGTPRAAYDVARRSLDLIGITELSPG
jgi:processive 1,2-diacylglycerol beta-glucosyltransferase